MTFRWLTTLGLMLGLHTEPGSARQLEIELDIQHVGGQLQVAELESLLASPDLTIEATYHPKRLIAGVTATRQKIMPFGSRLFPIPHQLLLKGEQIERQGHTLRFKVAEQAPERKYYRLLALTLAVPVAPGPGRPQPTLQISLPTLPETGGVHQSALVARAGTLDLGMRVRQHWSDSDHAPQRQLPTCGGDAIELDEERYLYRPRHRFEGYFDFLGPTVQSDPPSNPPPGQQSFQLHEPYPEPLAGWTLSRNHLLRLTLANGVVDRVSIHAQQHGPGNCQRSRLYEMLFADGQLVSFERSLYETACADGEEPYGSGPSVSASWLDDGSLGRFTYSAGNGSPPRIFDSFNAKQPAVCGANEAPPPAEQVQALQEEAQRLRTAFLRP